MLFRYQPDDRTCEHPVFSSVEWARLRSTRPEKAVLNGHELAHAATPNDKAAQATWFLSAVNHIVVRAPGFAPDT